MLKMLVLEAWVVAWAEGRREQALAAAGAALATAVASGLGYGRSPAGERLFDPVEADHFLDWSAMVGSDRTWLDSLEATNSALVDEFRDRRRSVQAPAGGGARFAVSLRRTFDLRRLPAVARARLRMPLPLKCEYHPEVSVTALLPAGPGVDATLTDGRLELRLDRPADPIVTIGADIELMAQLPGARPVGGQLPAAERQVYLRTSDGLIQVTPAIRVLAERLAGSAPPDVAVSAIAAHMSARLRFDFVRYDEIDRKAPGDWVIENGYHDCQLCAALLVALCRARGIPARMVAGNYLYRLSPTSHNWVEIWLDDRGWAPLDILHRERHRPEAGQGVPWWSQFAERGDYRLVSQRLPLSFTGPMSIRFPPVWQMLHAPTLDGVAIRYVDVSDGALVYQDDIAVKRLA